MKPATPKARELLAKLQALVDRGINGEKIAAQTKLDRLLARFDFTAPDTRTADLFAGVFQRASCAVPVATFTGDTITLLPSVKWAIEAATGIQCAMRGGELLAEATPKTAAKLAGIASTITEGFNRLWTQFQTAPGVNLADRGVFNMGLYDGMMNEARPALLPSRCGNIGRVKSHRARKNSVTNAPGIGLHPYSVAVNLGQQIRFNVPLNLIAEQLENTLNTKQIA